ncbi:MAG: hypothetical protein OHK0039_17240 [Bacteroidia bacterium]
MSYLQKIEDMYRLIGENKAMEALDTYYHDDVVVVDGLEAPRHGKEAQREALGMWFSTIKEMHGGGVGAITANEAQATTSVESWTEITTNDGARFKMEEVGVQQWQGDKIIHERFYYSMPGSGQ